MEGFGERVLAMEEWAGDSKRGMLADGRSDGLNSFLGKIFHSFRLEKRNFYQLILKNRGTPHPGSVD
jgi:hypothetical protein